MAKLKTRTNQPVIDEEGLLYHIAQDGNTTQIGGNLEVDGEIISGLPTPDSVFGNIGDVSPYTKEQLIDIALKYNNNGFQLAGYYDIAKIMYLNPNASYVENEPNQRTILIIGNLFNFIPDVNNGEYSLGLSETIQASTVIYFYYTDENTIMSSISEM